MCRAELDTPQSSAHLHTCLTDDELEQGLARIEYQRWRWNQPRPKRLPEHGPFAAGQENDPHPFGGDSSSSSGPSDGTHGYGVVESMHYSSSDRDPLLGGQDVDQPLGRDRDGGISVFGCWCGTLWQLLGPQR